MTDKKRFWSFLLVSFGAGWLLQGAGMLIGGAWYQLFIALAMFAPMLGVLLSQGGLRGVRWRPRVEGHVRWYLLAWFGPAVLSILCAALYFLFFPGRFDPGMGYMMAQIPAGTELPFPLPMLAAIQLAEAVTLAPVMNAFLAVGEEIGWRGYLTPYLTERFGRRPGLLLSGVVWAVWHWPLILLAGYEYGTGYPGAPYTGMLLMCVGCAAFGVLLTFLYEKTGSIWAPSLAHGAVNAAAGIGILFTHAGETSMLLGPTPFGLVAGLPLFALAAWVLLKRPKRSEC